MTLLDRRAFLSTCCAAGIPALGAAVEAPQAIGGRRELFVDDTLVESLTGDAQLRLATPIPRESVLKLDRPHEGPFSAYFTVLTCDDRKYRLYYRGVPDAGQDGRGNEVTCYAESGDGLQFTKPANNILLANQPPFQHNFCPFVDRNPRTSTGRYKALSGIASSGLRAWTSDDAVHWKPLRNEPVMPATKLPMFDSQNLAFYSEHEGCYVAYVRQFRNKIRSIVRATSSDFINWTPFEPLEIEGAQEHLYTNQLHPYFRAPHIYVGIAARFMPGRQVLSDEEAKQVGVVAGYFKDTSDSVLLTTRGGNRIQRTHRDGFLRPGYGLSRWSSRGNYPALNIVPTGSDGSEMSFYVNRDYGQPSNYLQRIALRTDGLASVHAGWRGGQVMTKPLTFTGRELEVNYSTSAAGSMSVGVIPTEQGIDGGKPLAECNELIGDRLDRVVRWRGNPDVSGLAGKPVRIVFQLRDADLYSYRFRA